MTMIRNTMLAGIIPQNDGRNIMGQNACDFNQHIQWTFQNDLVKNAGNKSSSETSLCRMDKAEEIVI